MKQVVDISKNRYEELRKNPVFFLKFFENIQYDRHHNEVDYSTWRSLDRDLNISFNAGRFADRTIGYTLCIIDSAADKKDENGVVNPEIVQMTIHSASPNSVNDWTYIINSFVIKSQNAEDKYDFMELLWALDKLDWNKTTLISTLSKYPSQTTPFLVNSFQRFGRVLSYNKQQILNEVCNAYNCQYNIYSPNTIKEAFDKIVSDNFIRTDYNNLNLFAIIDIIFEKYSPLEVNVSSPETNTLLKICFWLNSDIPLNNYDELITIFPTLSEELRLQSVKRYFHDLRNKRILFDVSYLQSLKENKYDEFVRYRFCVETPAEPILLTVPLLCDTLLTLYRSNGQSFQTFDGILDFAVMNCDATHPSIDFKLERFIPTCNRGAVFNSNSFKGFIDYALIRKVNEELITEEHLRATFIYLMDKHAKRQTYPVCKYGDGSIIPDEVFKHCSLSRRSRDEGDEQDTWGLECFYYLPYEDKWVIEHENINYIKEFLKESDLQYKREYNISLDMLSPEKLKEHIYRLPDCYQILGHGEFLMKSYKRNEVSKDFRLYLVQEYTDILRMRFFPQEGALVGWQFDVFGFREKIKDFFPNRTLQNIQSEQYKDEIIRLESQEVRKRCIASLKKELNTDFLNDSYFELHYNRILLSKIINRFYHKESFHEGDSIYQHEFLTQSAVNSSFAQFCAPQLSEAKNPAIDLPYFWCRGKECFHNNLGTQTLAEELNWRNYSLYHLSEIMGLPMLHKTEGGNEPEKSVWQFIAVVNKVMQKFKRLKCRSCGHLMFTDKSSGFNRNNYYACANPTCSEVSKAVYLNFCFKCKKGLIDSRDTKQCPNGWYICPTCFSCCDDEQYERQAQRYILTHRPIPLKIQEKRGHGHNDKGEYFCPQCGGAIVDIEDEHGYIHRMCQDCDTSYDEQ